jgi:hypothetical protein
MASCLRSWSSFTVHEESHHPTEGDRPADSLSGIRQAEHGERDEIGPKVGFVLWLRVFTGLSIFGSPASGIRLDSSLHSRYMKSRTILPKEIDPLTV